MKQMKRFVKRCMAAFLSAVMLVTLLPTDNLWAEDTTATTETVTAAKIGGSAGQSDSSLWLIATNESSSASGSNQSAAYTSGVTSNATGCALGSTRVGYLQFGLSDGMKNADVNLIKSAKVSIYVTSVNGNLGSYWTKAGLYRVTADAASVDTTTATTYPAKNDDYTASATAFSNEQISASNLGWKTFDVTSMLKEAVADGSGIAQFRLQTVISGWNISRTTNLPTLSVEYMTAEESVQSVADELTVASSTSESISLPTSGARGTTISWSSDEPGVISNSGVVTAPSENTEVTLTATVDYKGTSVTKSFTVTVLSQKEEIPLLAEYIFSDEYVSGSTDGSTISDASGNNKTATIYGVGATVEDSVLTLPGGSAGSTAAYVSIPGSVFENQDTVTITMWLKNQTGSGNYAAAFFGTPTKYYGGGTSTYPQYYWLFNPANPSGYFKSVWTKENTGSAPYSYETAVSTTKTGSDWAMYTTVITATSITGYYNGVQVSKETKTNTMSSFGTGLVAALGRSGYNDTFFKGSIRDVKVYSAELTQAQVTSEYNSGVLTIDNDALTLGDISAVKSDLTLPTTGQKGSAITWSSSDEAIIAADGKVTRPTTDDDAQVTLTATLTFNNKSVTKDFTVTVVSASPKNIFSEAVEALQIKTNTTESIDLPETAGDISGTPISIVWTSSNTDVLASDGTLVKRPASGEKDVVLTLSAAITYQSGGVDLSKTKEFTVTVRAEDYGYLMAYTNSKESTALGMSLHLAYSTDGASYTALNSNTGIVFANNAGGTKNVNPNGLASPYIFRKTDGTYGMIARNSTSSKYICVFDSTDLIHFTNEHKLAVSASVTTAPQLSYDETTGIYTIYWGDGTNTYATTTSDLENVIATTTVTDHTAETYSPSGTLPEGAVIGNVVAVSKSEYDLVVDKLAVVTNTGIESVSATADYASDLSSVLPSTVTADYSDGSTADFGVDWDLSSTDLGKAGTYQITGTIKQTEYENPFIEQRADPCITKGEDGYYYFTASYPMLGSSDKNGYDKVILRRAKTIEGLQDAEEVTIWDCDDSTNEYRYIWAPEIHCINGVYYIFYTSSTSSSSVWSIRPHVLRCNDPANIMKASSWQAMGQMQAYATDSQAFTNFSLDMTYFENNGHHYVMWAQTDGFSSLWIAEIDPDQPWKCISKCTKISIPEYSWERIVENVNEGPSVLIHDGKIYCTFSASGTGTEYCIGLLTADADADLLDADSWVKQSYPILTSADVEGEYGPGHNSFTVDEDGNVIFVYHARGEECYNNECAWASSDSLYDPCRDARIKRVHWAADGSPILKMTYDEELTTTTVTATVTIENDTSCSLNYAAAENGSIVGTASQSVAYGTDATAVTAVADTGYVFVKWSDGVTTATRTDSNVKSNIAVTAEFTKITYTLKYSAGSGGTIEGTASQTVSYGDDAGKVTAVADTGYQFVKWSDGVTTATRTDSKVSADLTVTAEFAKLTYTLKYSAGSGGTIAGTASQTVSYGDSASKVTAVADTGYRFVKWSDGVTTATRTDSKVSADITVTAEFAKLTYTLTYKAAAGGTISGTALQTVAYGDNGSAVTAKASSGYKFVKWSDGVTTATRTDKTVKASKTVTAQFEKLATKVTLDKTKLTLGVKETYTLTAKATPTDASAASKAVTWKSSNTKIATVSKSGKVTAKKAGTVKITATTGSGKTATCTITVKKAPSKVTLNATAKTLTKNKTFQLKATLPKNTASNKLTYTSSNTKVVSVSSSGKIKALKKGTATVTVKTFNGKTSKIKITVK